MLLRSIVIGLILAAMGTEQAAGCSCASYTPLCNADFDALSNSGVLFVGRVTSAAPKDQMELWQKAATKLIPQAASMQEISGALQSGNAELRTEFARLLAEEKIALWGEFMTDEERRAVLDDAQKPVGADFNFQWYGRRIEVDVVERFWGDVDETVVVQTGFGGGDCGVPFKEGEEYLIRSAAGKNGLYATGICGKTGHVRFHQDTLASLRAWQKGEPRPRIVSGVVQDWTARENRHPRGGYPPIEGVEVFLRG